MIKEKQLLAFLLVFLLTTNVSSENGGKRPKRTADVNQGVEIAAASARDEARNVSQSRALDYSIKVTMTNYGSSDAKVQQRYIFPDGVDVKSYSLEDESYRAKRSADNQRATQWVGGMVNLKPSDTKESDMTYINHPAEVINPSTKTFHKLSTTVLVKECQVIGGEISSPNYAQAYPNGADLTWLIAYPEGNVVKFEMEDLATEACCDRVIIYDGYNASHYPLATFEGSYYPSSDNVVYSTSPAMFIRFTSDCLSTDRGFKASYINQPQTPPSMSCGSVQLTGGNSGYVQSPNYPGTYDKNMNCSWPVQTYSNTQVKFVVSNLNTGYDDQVRIYDGTPSNPGNLLASLSGSVYSGYMIEASSYRAFVQFSSGSSSSASNKFYISYSGEYSEPETTASPPMSCGYVQSNGGDSGYISSPNYPGTYDRYMNCTWSVQTYYNTRVEFVVNNFNTGYDDQVIFFDGTPNNPGSRLRTLQGSYSSGYQFYASSYQAFVVFSSGSSSYYNNKFRIAYDGDYVPETTTAAYVSCGNVYYTGSYTGYIDSPNYPNAYPPNSNCMWGVSTAYGTQVTFSVENFSLSSGDYVYICDGTPSQSCNFVGYMSGSYSSGYTVTANSNQAYVWFVSNSYSYSGYKFKFYFYGTSDVTTYAPNDETTIWYYDPPSCESEGSGGDYIYGYNGYVTSPGYWSPGFYPPSQNCIWYISVYSSYGYDAIGFYPYYFSLEYGYDYVYIYNGYSTSWSNLINEITGYVDPYTTIAVSSSRYATVYFSSDSIINDQGFYLRFYGTYYSNYVTTTPSPMTTDSYQNCPYPYESGYSGYVESPNYPNNYYDNMNCSTWISTPYDTNIFITVQSFNLNSGDYLRVYDGFTGQYLGTYSGYYNYGATWQLYTRYIQLVFTTNSYYTSSGYRLRYDAVYDYTYTTASPSTCGGTMPYNSGTISSPNYPSYYYNNENCLWTVTVSSTKYVLFTVIYFNTESYWDYVAFYKGTPSNSLGQVASYSGTLSQGFEILVRDNQAYVTFYSDGSVTRPGFQISYSYVSTSYDTDGNSGSGSGFEYARELKPVADKIDRVTEKESKTIGKDLWGNAKHRPERLRRKLQDKRDQEETLN